MEVKHLAFVIGELEPFFCTLALFDVEKRLKISEDFHFDQNPDGIMKLLGKYLVFFLTHRKLFCISAH